MNFFIISFNLFQVCETRKKHKTVTSKINNENNTEDISLSNEIFIGTVEETTISEDTNSNKCKEIMVSTTQDTNPKKISEGIYIDGIY